MHLRQLRKEDLTQKKKYSATSNSTVQCVISVLTEMTEWKDTHRICDMYV